MLFRENSQKLLEIGIVQVHTFKQLMLITSTENTEQVNSKLLIEENKIRTPHVFLSVLLIVVFVLCL